MSLYQILENFKLLDQESFRDLELAPKEYNFLKSNGLVDAVELEDKQVREREETFEKYREYNGKIGGLRDRKRALETGLFVIKRKRRLADLEVVIAVEEEARKKVENVMNEDSKITRNKRKLNVEGITGEIYVALNDKGSRVLKDLRWMGDKDEFSYGSERYQSRVKSFREGEVIDFTIFFDEFLTRLNSLSDESAEMLTVGTGFRDIGYEGYDQKGGSYRNPAWIKYVRHFSKPKDSYKINEVPQGYTGFTFDAIDGSELRELKEMPFEPRVKTVPQTPTELAQVIIQHKRLNNLIPDYVPKEDEFFYAWVSNPYNLREISLGDERQVVIKHNNLNLRCLEEIERVFPEARRKFEDVVDYVKQGNAKLKKE